MNLTNQRITKIVAVSATILLAIFIALAMAFKEVAVILGVTFAGAVVLALVYAVYKLFETILEDHVDGFMENRERKERKKRIAEYERKNP